MLSLIFCRGVSCTSIPYTILVLLSFRSLVEDHLGICQDHGNIRRLHVALE